jgi:hypothetical protein
MVTSYEYKGLLTEISRDYLNYYKFLSYIGEQGIEYLDVVRKAHIKAKKIYEDRRMYPNWDAEYNTGKDEQEQRLNLQLTEILEYTSFIELDIVVHDLSEYKLDQRNCISYSFKGFDITKIINL